MTPYHWEQWGLDGRSKYVIKKRVELPSNPAKPFQSAVGFISFAVAGWMFRQFQHEQNQKAKWDALIQKRDEAISELTTQIELMEVYRDVELTANDNAVVIQQAELLAEVEVKLTQMEASELIFEAETAGMSEEQRIAYIEFIRNQQTPYLSGNQTLGKTIDPKDKVEGNETKSLETDWFTHAVDYFCVLIWGGQGGGKTTAASHIVHSRKTRGDRVVVLDPHAEKGQWKGLEVIGAGMNYKAIDEFMGWYFEECKRRYQILREHGKAAVEKLGRICLVAEELTNYAKRCKNSGDFIQACLSDNRKIFFNCLFISHGRTLALMGDAKGTSKTRDDSFLELHCVAPTGGSSRNWSVKYPGGEFLPVTVPEWKTIFDFDGRKEATPLTLEKLEEIWELECDRDSETFETAPETMKQPEINPSEDIDQRFTRFKMTQTEAIHEIHRLKLEMKFNQTEIIKFLWGEAPGGKEAYKKAVSEYKWLLGET